MVYAPPSKGARSGKSGVPKNGNKGNRGRGKGQDALASKTDLLAKLTRQAEEHTRILERERAALGLPTRSSPNKEPPRHQQQQHNQHPTSSNARNRRGNYHVYTDQGNKKVFDPRQIPGLGGGDGGSCAGGGAGRVPPLVPPEVSDAEQTFNQTFPDSPNFYPGRVFAIPGTIPPAPNQPQQSKPDGGTILVAPWGGAPQGDGVSIMKPEGPAVMQGQPSWQHSQPTSPGARGQQLICPLPMGMQQRWEPMGMGPTPQQSGGGRPPSIGYGSPQVGPGIDVTAANDPRVAARMDAEARKEAYRRELEEQIRAKKQAKEAEERRRREQDAAWEARAAAAPQPWDPEARAARRGGGGEPLRDEYGRPVANLRQRGGMPDASIGLGSPGPGAGLPIGMPPPQHGTGIAGPFPILPGPAGRLVVNLPGGGTGAFPGPGAGGIIALPFNGDGGALGPHGHGPGPQLAPLPLGVLPPPGSPGLGLGGVPGGGIGAFDGPAAPMLSPSHIPPVSPGNRRFMAAMNDLIAGPSDEQRRQKEMARQRLQMDLEEQIREKKERQARERAEIERQRLKEEAELKAFQDNMAAQRQAELQRQAASTSASGGLLSPQQQQQQPQQQQRAQQLQRHESSTDAMDGGHLPLPPRRHGRGGKIIDASWLDAPKMPPPAVLPPLSSPPPAPQISPGRGLLGRRASTGMADGAFPEEELAGGGQLSVAMSPGPGLLGRAPSHDGAIGVVGEGRGNVTTLLQQLQEEQSRLRMDFARQAAAMEKLASDASRALADRDRAWRELQRVKIATARGAAVVDGEDTLDSCDVGPVIVDTHLIPKNINSIPDPLPKPVSSEVLRRNPTDHGTSLEDMASRVLSPITRRGCVNDRIAGDLYGCGIAYGDLGPLQGPALNRNANGVRRSGIPLPPGMTPAAAAQHRPGGPRIQSVYGYGFGSPPKSRYNSFFGLEQGPPVFPGHGRAGGGASGLPSLGSRKQMLLKPPQSPAILRGDHLPSPVKQTRGPHQSQSGGARSRSGRPLGGGGAAERQPRGRAASAAPLPSQPKPFPELPLVTPMPGAVTVAGVTDVAETLGRQVSRRSLEGMQKVLRRGHEEKLLRGPLGLGSDDGSGSTGTTVEYVAEELPATSRSEAGRRQSREQSLPGHTDIMSPGAAAKYLGGGSSTGAAAVAAVGKAPGRSFFSDSMATYRSLLSHRSLAVPAGAGPPALGTEVGVVQADRPRSNTDARTLTQLGSAVGLLPAVSSRERDSSGDDDRGMASAGAAATVRVGTSNSQISDVPMQRPVRTWRRPSAQQRPPLTSDGRPAIADGGRSIVHSTAAAVDEG